MVVADNIQRIQTAKTNIRTSIINKGVSVPSNAKIDTYSGYIDQIQQGGVPQEQYDAAVLMTPRSYRIIDVIRNTEYSPRTIRNLPDIINSNSTSYFRYFIMENSESNADKYNICVARKNLGEDFTFAASTQIDPGNPYYYTAHWEGFRIKRNGSDVVASILYYIEYQSYNGHYYTCQTHTYYCVNITNNTFSNIVDLGQYSCNPTEQEVATIYSDWQTSCGISAAESIYGLDGGLGITSLSFDRGSTSYIYDLVVTLTLN